MVSNVLGAEGIRSTKQSPVLTHGVCSLSGEATGEQADRYKLAGVVGVRRRREAVYGDAFLRATREKYS